MLAAFVAPLQVTTTYVRNVINRRTRNFMTATGAPPNATIGRARNILITGSTKGVGLALAETFLQQGDTVIVSSRSDQNVQEAIITIRRRNRSARVFGFVADVGCYDEVERLATFASETLDDIDAWICNAGTSGQRRPVVSVDPETLEEVVHTNLLGSLYCAKEAVRISHLQTRPLHVFLVDGSGTIGNSTPEYAAYGATKRSIPQLVKSLNAEAANTRARFHVLSPGMVLTDLLLGGNPAPRVRKFFNWLAEEPETVSTELIPRICGVIDNDKKNCYIAFLTIPKAVFRLATGFLLGFRRNKFFDEVTGERVDRTGRYNENGVRLRR